MRRRIHWLFALSMWALPTGLDSQVPEPDEASLTLFSVVSAEDGRPVSGAWLELTPTAGRAGDPSRVFRALTDERGQAAFRGLSRGRYFLRVEHLAFADRAEEIEVAGDGAAEYRIELVPRAIALEPLEVKVTGRDPYLVRSGFYDRRATIDPGYFATFPEIEHYRTFDRLLKFQTDMVVRYTRPLVVLMDGVPAERRGFRTPRDLDDFDFRRVRGVEAYACSDAPPDILKWIPIELGLTVCNVLLIWTR